MCKENDLVQAIDIINNTYFSMEQAKAILTLMMEKYFYLNKQTDETKKEWGVRSYHALNALFNVVLDYTCESCNRLYNARNIINDSTKD